MLLILAPVNFYKSVSESKFELINTSYCYLKCCLLLWAMGKGERDQGLAEAVQREVRKWDQRSRLLTLVQTTSMSCLPWAWPMTRRGERSLQSFCRPAVICRPKAMLDEVSWQGHLGPGFLRFARAEQQGRGEVPFPVPGYRKKGEPAELGHNTALHSPGLEVMVVKPSLLVYWRGHGNVNEIIDQDGAVSFKGVLTVDLF